MEKVIQILLIEDDLINRFIFRKIAAQINIPTHIVECYNGQSAMDYLNSCKDVQEKIPDILFVDLNMPLMNGWEFIAELPKLGISKPILQYILTSSISPDDMDRYDSIIPKLEEYLVKPISKQKLASIIDLVNFSL
ncbi:response regulator [Pedobacter sp. BAL39]|uniref:response regulator n=1 Tax=Pedobacter sp. BAL39 TaxID=391596 RepID=UPI0012FA32E8|nr:response regulator [Pedobacter sp. BAL39]